MVAAPWLAIRCLRKRRSRAPFDHLGARKDGDAHRESSGGERGVQEGLDGAVRRRRWLMLRGNMANVTGASASWIEARVREIAGGRELLDTSRGKGEMGSARSGAL